MTLPTSGRPAPPFSPSLHRIYCASVYVCHNYRLRPGLVNAPWEEYLALRGINSYTFLTAYNPFSEIGLAIHENLARSQVLRSVVKEQGLVAMPAAGVDPSGDWPEEVGLMLLDVPLELSLSLGIQFEQNAVFHGSRGQAGRVLWCQCQLGP